MTVAGTGLTGLREQAQSLEGVRDAFGTAFTTADAITETVTLTSGAENYTSVATLKSDASALSGAATSADDITGLNLTVDGTGYTSYDALVAAKATADGAVTDFFAAAVPATADVTVTGALATALDTFAITITGG